MIHCLAGLLLANNDSLPIVTVEKHANGTWFQQHANFLRIETKNVQNSARNRLKYQPPFKIRNETFRHYDDGVVRFTEGHEKHLWPMFTDIFRFPDVFE